LFGHAPTSPVVQVNAPDLYIPLMAFVTYVLVAGLAHGVAGEFKAEELGAEP
jgi:hypothetical protein